MQTNIIGISGTNGSGKDTVGQILAEQFNYVFISVTDLLRQEASHRSLPADRDTLRTISAEWRRQSGLGVLVDKALAVFSQQTNSGKLALASLRNHGEVDRVHELGGIVLWLDAPPRLRYDRIQANAAARNRAAEDQRTFDQFLADEQVEMQASGDAATLDMLQVKVQADIVIINDFSNIPTLAQEIGRKLNLA
jgi:dephospho-CoA kinase